MRIFITGISGFVGINLNNYLNKSFKVQGISRLVKEKTISYKQLNNSILNTSKAFIHLAGIAHDLKKTSNEKEYFEVNTELTKKLFKQFLESNCEVFIYMSSVKAVADIVENYELTEEVTPNPITAYGKSKLAAENHILKQKIPSNKRVYILRPCMIHGPKNKGNLNILYTFVSKGIPYPFGKFKNKRSFLYIENLCYVIKRLIENETVPSGVYNVSDDNALSTNDLVTILGASIGRKPKIINIPKFCINILGKFGNFLPLPIDSEKVKKLTENYIVSNQKIKKVLNIKKLPFSIEEGLERTFKSFKTNL